MNYYDTTEDYLLELDGLRLEAYEQGKFELANSYNALVEELEREELATAEELALEEGSL